MNEPSTLEEEGDISDQPTSKDYFFTFHILQHSGAHANHFVRVNGTYAGVREQMDARYNREWFSYHDSLSSPEMQGKTEIPHFM